MQQRVPIACLAPFPRGTGLGNRLFHWARVRVFCREHGLPMVAPRWWRPALPAMDLANLALGILYLGHWFVVIPYTTLRMALLPKTLVWAKTLHGGAGVEPALADPTP